MRYIGVAGEDKKCKGAQKRPIPKRVLTAIWQHRTWKLIEQSSGAVISAGSELEKLILERCKTIENFDKFITNLDDRTPGIFVATKRQIKSSKLINTKFEPDLLAFDLARRICYVIEVKDGDQFDTKKAEGERVTLHSFVNDVASTLPFSFMVYMCSFNARNKDDIYKGLKRKFPKDELLTGKQLCDLLGINFEDIVMVRKADQGDNISYFAEQLLNIPEIEEIVKKRLKS